MYWEGGRMVGGCGRVRGCSLDRAGREMSVVWGIRVVAESGQRRGTYATEEMSHKDEEVPLLLDVARLSLIQTRELVRLLVRIEDEAVSSLCYRVLGW